MQELENFKRKVDLAGFKRERDRIIGNLYNNGATFLGMTIEYPEFQKYNSTEEKAMKYIKNSAIHYYLEVVLRISLVEFISISIETDSNEKESSSYNCPRLHILLCFRNLVKFEYRMINEIVDSFEEDITRADYLKSYREISDFWTFATKKIIYGNDIEKFYLIYYRADDYDIYGRMGDFLDMQSTQVEAICGYKHHKDSLIEGLNFNKIKSEETVLINLIKIFMIEQDIFLIGDSLYQKKSNSRFSCTRIGDLKSLSFLSNDILEILAERFPTQLDKKDIQYLIIEQLEKALAKIELAPFLLPKRERLGGLLEFKDGVYVVESASFLKIEAIKYNEIFQELEKRGSCAQFFDRKYKGIGRPSFWLSNLKKKLKTESEVEKFCTAFGRLINLSIELVPIKQQIATILKKQNITDYFFLEILNTCYGLFEVESKNQKLSGLAKLIHDLLTTKKNKSTSSKTLSSFTPLSDLNQTKSLLENEQFLVKMIVLLLSQNGLDEVNEKAIDKVKLELPKIIIYCNRLFISERSRSSKKSINKKI